MSRFTCRPVAVALSILAAGLLEPLSLIAADSIAALDAKLAAMRKQFDDISATGDWERALTIADAMVHFAPQVPGSFVTRAIARGNMEQLTPAKLDLDEAFRLGAKGHAAYAVRGFLSEREGKFDLALDDANRALKLDPKDDLALRTRAEAYAGLGRDNEAIQDFTAALKLRPNHSQTQVHRGATYGRLGKYAEAEADFAAVLKRQPDYVDAFYGHAAVLSHMGRNEDALLEFGRGLAIRNDEPKLLLRRAELLRKMGRSDAAIADFEHLIQVQPKNALAYAGLSATIAMHVDPAMRDMARVIEYAKQAVTLTQENDPTCLQALVAAYETVGDFIGAAGAQRKVLIAIDAKHLPPQVMAQAQGKLAELEKRSH